MNEHNFKFSLILNTIINIPLSIILSITGLVSSGNANLLHTPVLLINIAVGFAIGIIINIVFPIQRIFVEIPLMLQISPYSIFGFMLGGLPLTVIYTSLIGIAMCFINVSLIAGLPYPAFLFVFIDIIIPIFLVGYVVSIIIVPIANAVATKLCDTK